MDSEVTVIKNCQECPISCYWKEEDNTELPVNCLLPKPEEIN